MGNLACCSIEGARSIPTGGNHWKARSWENGLWLREIRPMTKCGQKRCWRFDSEAPRAEAQGSDTRWLPGLCKTTEQR